MLRTIILMTRGIILDPAHPALGHVHPAAGGAPHALRRFDTFLSGSIATAMGLHPLLGHLRMAHPRRACCWRLWDLLLLRAAARRERRRLEKEIIDAPDA